MSSLEQDIVRLAKRFGDWLIVTDRFAVAVNTSLRVSSRQTRQAVGPSHATHLNEQVGEKNLVEKQLYPEAASYTDVYVATVCSIPLGYPGHCIYMNDTEWVCWPIPIRPSPIARLQTCFWNPA